MLEKISNSLAYRVPVLYRYFSKLVFKVKGKQPFITKINIYNLALFSGRDQLDMLNVCLNSVYRNFKQLPHIYIFTDQSLSVADCKKAIRWFPEKNVTIIDSLTCLVYHENKGHHLRKKFAAQNPMGLKLAAILQILDFGKPVLYCDTDVIWYQDPIFSLINLLKDPHFHLALSDDFQPAYDTSLIQLCELVDLEKAPYFCAGIMFINKLIEKHHKVIDALLPALISQSNHFSEQTIFAFLNKQEGSFCLDKTKFVMKFDDHLNFLPNMKAEIIARHYVGAVRHLFWRDAIFN